MRCKSCEQTYIFGFRELFEKGIRGLREVLLLRGGQDLSPLALVDLNAYITLAQMVRWKVHTLGVSVSEASI